MKYTVRQARSLKGLTQVEMAKLLGISRDTYIKIETNPSRTTVAQACQISKITGIPFNDIIFFNT